MDYLILGKTGITVSALGIGTGGPSRVGLRTGGDEQSARTILRLAVDHGVTFVDTAEAYGTEELTGSALEGLPRRELVLSTKISHWERLTADTVEAAVDARLMALRTDYLDVCHFHAVPATSYDWLREELAPALLHCKEAGKIRATGITEAFNRDPSHQMLNRAVEDDIWDVIMVGCNMLNQSARTTVLPAALRRGLGVLDMFAVRLALSRTERLVKVIEELCQAGHLSRAELEQAGGTAADPLGWVVRESDAQTLAEAAYRFVRHEEAVHVTLSGTGNVDHLMQNIEAVQLPPLDRAVTEKLHHLFRNVDSVSGE